MSVQHVCADAGMAGQCSCTISSLQGSTPLIAACKCSSTAVMKLLLDHHADVDIPTFTVIDVATCDYCEFSADSQCAY